MLINFYKIVCPGDEVYVGSTKFILNKRWSDHKSHHRNNISTYTSKILFDKYGIENCKIELIETRECEEKERYRIEGEYIRSIPNCVNEIVSGRTKQEYYEDNKEQIKDRVSKYREANKEQINQALREKRRAIKSAMATTL